MFAEYLCRRCGQCCFEKVVIDNEVIMTEVPCKYLDVEKKICKIYQKRHVGQTRCLSVEEGIKARAFPAGCPYVEGVTNYQPPVKPELSNLSKKMKAEVMQLSTLDFD